MKGEHSKLMNKQGSVMKAKEKEILQLAVKALKENTNLQAEIEQEDIRHPDQGGRADFLLRITMNQQELHYYAEVKPNITNITLAQTVIHIVNEAQIGEILLVTNHVTAQMADRLRQENIQFIDTAGNAYINHPPLYIFIKGHRLADELRPVPVKRAFKPTGLKIIFAFLCNPGLENKPYREIAAAANVALGTVGWIMRDLKEKGYMITRGKRGNKLIKKENLFERWVIEYPEKLRPKLILGRYQRTAGWWEQEKLNPEIAQWGGELAAAKITQFLKPEFATIYIEHKQLNNFLIENRLKKDLKGDTEILERFWRLTEQMRNEDTVHPLLVYADLIATDYQRNIETAKMIYEQHIIQLIRKD